MGGNSCNRRRRWWWGRRWLPRGVLLLRRGQWGGRRRGRRLQPSRVSRRIVGRRGGRLCSCSRSSRRRRWRSSRRRCGRRRSGSRIGGSRCRWCRLRLGLGVLRCRLAVGRVLVAAPGVTLGLAFGALRSPAAVVIDPGDRDGSAVRIDADGPTAIFELVLSLRSTACQQDDGRQQPFHRESPNGYIPKRGQVRPRPFLVE